MTMMPTIAARATECQKTKRKIEPSLPTWFVAAVAMQMDCASIILPITPPALFVAHIKISKWGVKLSCCAVIFCKPPKSAFEEVSLPVSATPSHPMNVPKNGKSQPVRVNASPRTASMPEYRVTYPKPSMHVIATIANLSRTRVRPKIWNIFPDLRPRSMPAKRAARKQPVPVAVSQLKSNRAASAVAFWTTGAARNTLPCKYGQSHPGGPGRTLPSAITTLKEGVVALFITNFTEGNPHTRTNRERIAKGIQALAIWPLEKCLTESLASAAVTASSSAKRQIFFGCQKRRKTSVAAMDTTPAAISTRLLSMWLAQNHCVAAKEPPTTRMAGKTSKVSFQLTIARTSQKGTMMAVIGRMRPIIALRSLSLSAVTAARV